MREDDRARGNQRLTSENSAYTVLSYLIGGVLVWGLLGWLGDSLLHTGFLLPIGILVGAAGAIYLIIQRFGEVGPRRSDK